MQLGVDARTRMSDRQVMGSSTVPELLLATTVKVASRQRVARVQADRGRWCLGLGWAGHPAHA